MKNIFIWSWSWSEHKICAYQSTIVYNFFLTNWYNLVKSANDSDYILLNWYPFEENEERLDLLTIWYYFKMYPKSKIILIWSIPWMMKYLKDNNRIISIWYTNYSKFNEIFKHNIQIEDIKVDSLKYFIPLNIESLNIENFWYNNNNIESKYIFTEDNLRINYDKLLSWNYSIEWIGEYDTEKYNYLKDISWEYPIEICTGCWWYCTYCDIRNIAGFVKSISINNVINKIKRGLSLWFKEFHFIDEDSASYWLDIWLDFADLLNEINKIDWDFKIKIFYFEPGRLEKLYDKIDKNFWDKVRNFCVPLQTTSQKILKLMNRKYNISNVIDIVDNIKNINNKIVITTQFIYWFPTETFEEFKEYFKMINHFDELWFWYYSDRRWTESVQFLGKIDKKEMVRRLIFLWKVKERYINKVFDKNEYLKQWIDIFKRRDI